MGSILLGVSLLLCGADHPRAVCDAANDLLNPQKVAPFLREYTRYLDFSDLPQAKRANAVKVLFGHVNQLSRNARIVVPRMATPTLMAVVIKDYHWRREVWESLKEVDPYFHVTLEKRIETEEDWAGGIWKEDNKYYPPRAFKIIRTKRERKVVGAIQLHTNQEAIDLLSGKITERETSIGKLIEYTQSEVPILDAVWFYQQTVADFGRKPGYHNFLDFNNQKEFEELLGFKEVDSRKYNDLWREAVSRSKVLAGAGARRIEVFSKPGGFLWRTKDSQVKKDRRNPLRVVNDDLEFDASEQFGGLPNGFTAWGLFDFKGVRQDSAPDKVVGHQNGAAGDTKLHNCISCLECHEKASVKDFDPWFRKLFAAPKGLESPDYDEFLKLSRQYLEYISEPVEDSRVISARAIFKATGFTPQEWSAESWELWKYYLEAKVDLTYAARSLGTTPAAFQQALHAIKAKTGIIDPVLATFLKPPGSSIAIDTWEEVFPIAHSYLRGISP